MATFTITINMDNQAFDGQDGREAEVGRILNQLENRIMNGDWPSVMPIFDFNGNRVGTAVVTDTDQANK